MMIITISIYWLFVLLIPLSFNAAYTTYPKSLKGYIGLFYAGNEVANTLVLLFPAAYLYLNNKKYDFLIIFPIIYLIISIYA